MVRHILWFGVFSFWMGQTIAVHADEFIDAATRASVAATARAERWDGPTKGPKAANSKSVVFIAADMTNGGIRGVADGVAEATNTIGWALKIIDGKGSIVGRTRALQQALKLKPDAIIIGGYDTSEAAEAFNTANKAGIILVGWHSGSKIGPETADGIFANIGTTPKSVAEIAADGAIADSDGKAGVIILTDSHYDVAVYKARAMEAVLRNCRDCKVLEFVDVSIADAATQVPALTKTWLQRYGDKWTYTLAINDRYFDFMGAPLATAGKKPDGFPRAISAGDGSPSAYKRIRLQQFQIASVPEPLNLQGWQLTDELNRAFNKAPWSAYIPKVHLVMASNIGFDGGPDNIYDPNNKYREHYKTIWGK